MPYKIKKIFNFSLFDLIIVFFFLIVFLRGALLVIAFHHSNELKDKNRELNLSIVSRLQAVDKMSDESLKLLRKKITNSISSEAISAIDYNDKMTVTNNQIVNFAYFSMICLSLIFAILMIRFNRKIKKDNIKLASIIEERKVIEQMLEKKNHELAKANQALDSFVYSASHDLRAPLTSMMGLIRIAEKGERDESKQQIFDMMKASVEKLDSFIKDIIEYSRNSRLDMETEKIDFKEIIQGCLDQLNFMEGADKINIDVKVSGKEDFFSDKKRLTALFNNLLSNGIKYHNRNEKNPYINIDIQIKAEEAYIQIKDNGLGISPLYIDRIFNMFYRATQASSGSGLGLYIVKEILEKMSGSVRVESEEHVGTTFFLSVPNSKEFVS